MTKGEGGAGRRIAGKLAVLLAKGVATALVVTIPVLGVWAGSSFAAYLNGPIWVAIVAGLVLFPVLPLAWDGWAAWRRKRKEEPRPRILTFWDRIVARTFVLNLAFLGVFLAGRPQTIFTSLSARGDWMIEGWEGGTADAVRGAIFDVADGLSWLYEATEDDPFEQYAEAGPPPESDPHPGGRLGRRAVGEDWGRDAPSGLDRGSGSEAEAEAESAPDRDADPELAWPFPERLHPAVAGIPPEAETSVRAVADHLAERESDPYLRVKALHDWVADNIAYDAPAYAAGEYTPQDAATVFRERKAVCAGYAKLMVALGRAVGEEIVYVRGDARTGASGADGESHAWNAVRIEGDWYLLDATWDAGHVDGTRFTKGYRTIYFLTPPEVFGIDHYPDLDDWQLRDDPMTRGEFNRQPKLNPAFFVVGMELVEPARSQVSVSGRLRAVVDNPLGRFMLGTWRMKGSESRTDCRVDNGPRAEIVCDLPRRGTVEVLLFEGPERYGSYRHVGTLEATNRP